MAERKAPWVAHELRDGLYLMIFLVQSRAEGATGRVAFDSAGERVNVSLRVLSLVEDGLVKVTSDHHF